MSATASVAFGYIFTTVLYASYWIVQRNKLRALTKNNTTDKAA